MDKTNVPGTLHFAGSALREIKTFCINIIGLISIRRHFECGMKFYYQNWWAKYTIWAISVHSTNLPSKTDMIVVKLTGKHTKTSEQTQNKLTNK